MNELAFYTLAGAPRTPRDLIAEVQQGEAMGIGSAFISERFNIKEAATLSGAVGAVSNEIGIATAATNHNTRHPMVTACFAMTMHKLTGGRFSLGLGRGIGMLFDLYGLPRIKTAEIEDFVGLMRRLWRGEMVMGHDGPAGRFRSSPRSEFAEHIPMTFTAFAQNSLRLGGRAFDAVVLHTFFTDETTVRCVRTVQAGRRGGGPRSRPGARVVLLRRRRRPPPGALRLKKTVGRMATYLQGYGDLMVKTNRWDPACCNASGRMPSCRASGARSTPRPRPISSSTSRPDPRGVAGAGGDRLAGACVERSRAARARLRRRDPARREPRSSSPSWPRTAPAVPPAGSITFPPTPAPPRRSGLHASLNRQRNRLSRLGLALRTLCSTGRFRKSTRDQPIFTFLLPRPFVSALHRASQLGDSSQGGFPTSFLSAQHTRP